MIRMRSSYFNFTIVPPGFSNIILLITGESKWSDYLGLAGFVQFQSASNFKLMRLANYEQLPVLKILFRNFQNFSL